MQTASWTTTEAVNNRVEDISTNQVILEENCKENPEVFTVETYSDKDAPAFINLQETRVEKMERHEESNV